MKRLQILGAAALALVMLSSDALAQRRGGAVSSGVRGAVVGGAIGGSGGAATGAKVGVVTGATRAAVDRENQSRTQYTTTTEYQNAQHSNYNETPPEILGTTAAGTAKKASGEAVIRQDGKSIVGVTFPSDWNQRTGDNYISAVSADGQAYAMLVIKKEADKAAAIKKLKEGLETYLTNITYDDPGEAKAGTAEAKATTAVITGTGKAKKAGVDAVFAASLSDVGQGQIVVTAFVVDSKIEDHYKETIRGICETIRFEKDFTEQPQKVAKPVTK